MKHLQKTPRTTASRKSARVSHDKDDICTLLDQVLVAHIGFVESGGPMVLPVCAWRVDDHLYFHFAFAGRFAKALRGGAELCVTASVLDGLVLARSAMHHSVNYRSVMLFGTAVEIVDPDEKTRILAALVDKVRAGRSGMVRAPDAKELAATGLFALPIAEGSYKARSGPPADRSDDLDLPVWGGVVPALAGWGAPEADEHVKDGIALV